MANMGGGEGVVRVFSEVFLFVCQFENSCPKIHASENLIDIILERILIIGANSLIICNHFLCNHFKYR